jgi:hypothetical protein
MRQRAEPGVDIRVDAVHVAQELRVVKRIMRRARAWAEGIVGVLVLFMTHRTLPLLFAESPNCDCDTTPGNPCRNLSLRNDAYSTVTGDFDPGYFMIPANGRWQHTLHFETAHASA